MNSFNKIDDYEMLGHNHKHKDKNRQLLSMLNNMLKSEFAGQSRITHVELLRI